MPGQRDAIGAGEALAALKRLQSPRGLEPDDVVNVSQLHGALSLIMVGVDATVAPPEVETVGLIGVATGRYARELHTHSGVNLTDAQQIDGLKTLNNHLRFIDATWNIGAAGASRPANLYLSAAVLEGAWQATQVAALYGGTGQPGGYTVGDMLVASGAEALSKVAAVATGQVWASTGIGVTPAWSGSPTLTALTLSSAAPTLTLTDTTGGANSLTIAVDANLAQFRESAGASGSLLVLDLANLRLGVGLPAPLAIVHIQTTGTGNKTGLIVGRNTVNVNDLSSIVFNSADLGDQGAIDSIPISGTAGDLAFRIRTGSALVEKLRIKNTGNIKIAGSASRSATEGTNQVVLFNGTAPVGTLANGVSLYSEAGECTVMDAGGTASVISPHPATFLATLPVKDRPFPWAYQSDQFYLGSRIQVDMAGVVAAVERLSGEQYMFIEPLPEKGDWDTDQMKIEQAEALARDAVIEQKRALDIDIFLEAHPVKRDRLLQQQADLIIPEPYQKQPPPQWLRDRGVVSAL